MKFNVAVKCTRARTNSVLSRTMFIWHWLWHGIVVANIVLWGSGIGLRIKHILSALALLVYCGLYFGSFLSYLSRSKESGSADMSIQSVLLYLLTRRSSVTVYRTPRRVACYLVSLSMALNQGTRQVYRRPTSPTERQRVTPLSLKIDDVNHCDDIGRNTHKLTAYRLQSGEN